MNCCFFGHRDAPESIQGSIEKTVIRMIDIGITRFFVGNNGNFDFYVQRVLQKLQRSIPSLDYTIVLSSLGEAAIEGPQENTLFPEGLELAPRRFAISRRNDWMLLHSSYVIAYMKYRISNCHTWIEKARKRGMTIINLFDDPPFSNLPKEASAPQKRSKKHLP